MSETSSNRFVVVANRLPVDLETPPDGGPGVWRRSPGGLVTALEPVLRSADGAWVGWPGTPDVDLDPFVEEGLTLHPVRLSEAEVTEYYEGFSNETLWPLYHDAVIAPTFDRAWWRTYEKVNRRFAEEAARAAAPGATVWVHDYQLQLVPRMLRDLRPDLRIGFFLHIPFPPTELFLQLPWRKEILEGLMGADLVGFHLPGGAENFLYLARRLLDLPSSPRGTTGGGTIDLGDRRVRVGAYPISIDSAQLRDQSVTAATKLRAKEIRAELGDPETILLGVDRLDYTKGISVRLEALRELLVEGTLDPEKVVMVQLATPSRERLSAYASLRDDIERQVGNINGEFGQLGRPVVHYLHRPVDRDELVAMYAGADVMVVTPFRDGMNLVAKEYVACHGDGSGALVLSEFAGAAAELRRAHVVNPHDLEDVKRAVVNAVGEDRASAARRMRSMHKHVMAHDVDRWANSFLSHLTEDH
ncbi:MULTISPECIES: alpha,alpha-trehalose-phosphate synthase (UDP-forming) [unclassified Rhodococcus (in: high G+C Gram-positive bacteria)]|uniref:alpha,alpha-trehalose-phosphate synthase (UDP-forming) n=1 Tax=unclassified Rhodococcus (in: high G+C Gram-positive bacteria) TaxID=192944 RepID=UPI00146AF53C|nr:trehalose-6-phosphate synthase [Rhodococcus sp. 105337]NME77676.1 trehalose-6-phosphate synthase [Rhodococcus sp. 105337]